MIPSQLGDWCIVRSIVDADTGDVIRCDGVATLRRCEDPDGDGRLRYDENVAIHLGERLVRATRTYFYTLTGFKLTATFADGRHFFGTTVRPNGTATAIHYCGADVYRGTLTLRGDDWETRWDVSGSKVLAIATRYRRIESPTAPPAAQHASVRSPS